MSNILTNLTKIFNKRSTRELKSITGAVDNALTTASEDINLLNLEYILTSSTGEWLDEWGSWFGVPRLIDENDESYRNRILATCVQPKSTIPSIIDAINKYFGKENMNIQVYEPYVDIFKPSVTPLDQGYRFQNGTYYRPGVIDVIIEGDITPGLIDTIEQTKGAGILVYFTRNNILYLEVNVHDPYTNINSIYELAIKNPATGLVTGTETMRCTDLGYSMMVPTITVSTDGWEGFSIIADIEEMTIDELTIVRDMSQPQIEITLLS